MQGEDVAPYAPIMLITYGSVLGLIINPPSHIDTWIERNQKFRREYKDRMIRDARIKRVKRSYPLCMSLVSGIDDPKTKGFILGAWTTQDNFS